MILVALTLCLCSLVYIWSQRQSIKSSKTSFYPKYIEFEALKTWDKTLDIKSKLSNEKSQKTQTNGDLRHDISKDLLNERDQEGNSQGSSAVSKHGTLKLPYKAEEIQKGKDLTFSKDSRHKFCNETVIEVDQGDTVTRRFPNCIIFGTRKSGTAALMKILDIHPKVYLLNAELPFNFSLSYYTRLEESIKKMPSYEENIIIHKNADYFSSKHAICKLFAYYPNVKLIVTVKHPLTRAVADYRQFKDVHPWVNKSFQEFVTKQPTGALNLTSMPLNASVYVQHLQNWYIHFPKEQIHIVDGEKLITDPLAEIWLVEDFLGLKHEITSEHVKFDEKKGFYCMRKNIQEEFHCLSKRKGGVPKPYVDPNFEQRLREFYHPYNEQFFKLINRTFNWE